MQIVIYPSMVHKCHLWSDPQGIHWAIAFRCTTFAVLDHFTAHARESVPTSGHFLGVVPTSMVAMDTFFLHMAFGIALTF